MNLPNEGKLPCFLCGRVLQIKNSKNDKPYFICNQCGLQSFIRFKPGIDKLKRVLSSMEGVYNGDQNKNYKILTSISNLNELKNNLIQFKENKSVTDVLLPDSDKDLRKK